MNSIIVCFKSLDEGNVSIHFPITNEEKRLQNPINIYVEANDIDSAKWKAYKNGEEIVHNGNGTISFLPNQEIGYISLGARWDFTNPAHGGKGEKLGYIAWLGNNLDREELSFFSENGFVSNNNPKVNEELYCQVDRDNKMITKEGNVLNAVNYPSVEQQEFRIDGLPIIQNSLRFNGSTNFLKINNFNPTAEKGYNHILIMKNDIVTLPPESVHRMYQVNDILGSKVDHGTLTNFSGLLTIRMRPSGGYSSGLDDYRFEDYTPELTSIYSFYNEVLQGDVRRTVKVNNSILVSGSNVINSEAGEGDYSKFGESVLNIGAGFSRGNAVSQWPGQVLFYGMLKGELSHEHYLEIWNNGSPRMPKKEWGYDWQVVANLNRPIDSTGIPKIENLASLLNPGVQNFEILMEGYSIDQLDSANPHYAFVNIDTLK